jgi:shikimate kinase/3-dehydroquinate synthase
VAIVLIGFMGAGKSTLAARLAEGRGVSPLDSDALLAERFGHPVAREFELHGERSFRAAEEELVCELLDDAGTRDVIALGGGSVLSGRVREALANGRNRHLTVLLDVDPALAWERVRASEDDGSERPLARDRDAFHALHAERRGLYEELADAVLLWAESPSGDYPVFVGRGLLDGEHLAAVWPLDPGASRPVCVTDATVAELYGERLRALGDPDVPVGLITIEPGERHKTLVSAERVWRELLGAGVTRADHVVALGGGVVGDLAGFCAATYQRGVPVVHVPTTLVAQVDSAYGGKTGVDLPDAKNYVGAYHQPAGVLVDPDLLATLPAAELAAGWVEVLKTALIAGGALWEHVSTTPGCDVDERTIRACAATKLAVVAADERDAGARQVLNLGHTVGHAIETVTGYARYRHGEAVGLGLLAALRLSGADALREQVRELLLARALPVTLDGADVDLDEIVAATARDKKLSSSSSSRGNAGVPFVRLNAPGDVEFGREVPAGELRAAVGELTAV